MVTTRCSILFGNDPQAYRQTLATVVKAMRQELEVIIVAPEELDDYVRRRRTCLVICSRLTETIMMTVANWILLYPDGTPLVEINCGDERMSCSSFEFNDLIALIDRAVTCDVAPPAHEMAV